MARLPGKVCKCLHVRGLDKIDFYRSIRDLISVAWTLSTTLNGTRRDPMCAGACVCVCHSLLGAVPRHLEHLECVTSFAKLVGTRGASAPPSTRFDPVNPHERARGV
eukprot:2301826-Prymnesium_polylepis.1